MEETKIWKIEKTSATQLDNTNQMETEGLLEEILTENPGMLEEGLELVGRQSSTASGPLDLLGVDSGGRLVVFELKRGTLYRDAVAQVIDYASYLNTMDFDRLYKHIEEHSRQLGTQKIKDFDGWYSETHPNKNPEESLKPPRMVLVGLGVDDTTERIVEYLASNGTNISLLTFYGFIQEGTTLLARHVEVSETINPPPTDEIKEFERYAAEIGVSDLLRTAMSLIGEVFRYERRWASVKLRNRKRMNFSIGNQAYLFLAIDPTERGIINVGFHPVAVDLALEAFDQLNYEKNGEPFRKIGPGFSKQTEQVDYAVDCPIKSLEEWKAHKDKLKMLTEAVYEAYQKT